MRKLFLAAVVVLVAAGSASAQDRKVGFNFGGGVTFPVSGLNDAFDTGWNGTFGVTFNVNEMIGFQTEYMYHRLGGPERFIEVFPGPGGGTGTQQLIESNHQVHNLGFNLVVTPTAASDSVVGAYFLGGGGWYHRLIQLTSPSVGYASICDPYWLICYPTLVEVDRIIGDRSTDNFGINLGAGITFGTDAKFYVETRYTYVWGPTVTGGPTLNPGGGRIDCSAGCSTNAGYWPITFGVRW
jgi:hypothetical protein